MPEVQKGLFVSENLLEENRALYYKRQQERREAKKRAKAEAKAKLEEAYKSGEKKRKRFWFF